MASSEADFNVTCVICLQEALLRKPVASAVMTQELWAAPTTWMYYKNWIQDWQYGGMPIFLQWPIEVLQLQKNPTGP